ncbi:MAG: hypothetical protein ACLTOX_06720 [Streptococcus thermophilus]
MHQAIIDIQMTTDYDEGKFKQLLATLNQAYDTFKKVWLYQSSGECSPL